MPKQALNKRAVLDIGSNTIRLLIAQENHMPPSLSHRFQQVHYEHHIVRMGEGLQQTGALGAAAKKRSTDAFKRIIKVCQSHGIPANHIKAVATAAIREATNGADFVRETQAKTGLNIQVISGDDEAKLALQGASLALPQPIHQDMLLFDIGGGSSEFTRVQQGKLIDSISLKLGVVRLTESNMRSDPPSAQDYQALQQSAKTFIKKLETFWTQSSAPSQLPLHLVGTAGTVTTLAAIAQHLTKYRAQAINGYALSRDDFYALRQQLCQQTNAQRLAIPLLEQGREDVIIAGLAIIEVLFQRWQYDALIAVDSGLLEGLLHSAPSAS